MRTSPTRHRSLFSALSLPPLLPLIPLISLVMVIGACEPKEDPYATKKSPRKSLTDYNPEMSPEELAKARELSDHDSQDKVAEENAMMFEKGAREYIKTRMAEYRDFMKEFAAAIDEIEKKAPKWGDDAAFEKFNAGYKETTKELTSTFDALTKKGSEGGNTQADLGAAFRAWEDLNGLLGPGIHEQQGYPETLESIRERIGKVNAALDEIESDETLEVNPLYKPPKKKKKK